MTYPMICAGLAVSALITQTSTDPLAHTLQVTNDAYIQTENSNSNEGSDRKVKFEDDGVDESNRGCRHLPDNLV